MSFLQQGEKGNEVANTQLKFIPSNLMIFLSTFLLLQIDIARNDQFGSCKYIPTFKIDLVFFTGGKGKLGSRDKTKVDIK